MKEHIPKKHGDLENPIITDKVFDNTSNRIYGELNPQPMISETYHIGKSTNPADNLAKAGRKEKMFEQEVSVSYDLNLICRLQKKSQRSRGRSRGSLT